MVNGCLGALHGKPEYMVLMNAVAAFGRQTDLAQCLELFDMN
jgi:hypothetical protein